MILKFLCASKNGVFKLIGHFVFQTCLGERGHRYQRPVHASHTPGCRRHPPHLPNLVRWHRHLHVQSHLGWRQRLPQRSPPCQVKPPRPSSLAWLSIFFFSLFFFHFSHSCSSNILLCRDTGRDVFTCMCALTHTCVKASHALITANPFPAILPLLIDTSYSFPLKWRLFFLTFPVLILTRHTSSPRGPPPPFPMCDTTHTHTLTHTHTCTHLYMSVLFLSQIFSSSETFPLSVAHAEPLRRQQAEYEWDIYVSVYLTDWLTDCFCLPLSLYRPFYWLSAFWLSCCLCSSFAMRFIYQSACAYLNLWPNELMISSFGLIYSCLCLCVFSLSVSSCLSIHFSPPMISISFYLPACPSWQGAIFAVLSHHISSPVRLMSLL